LSAGALDAWLPSGGIDMRIGLLVCAATLWALPATAQELELRPPTMTARDCSSHQLALCGGPQRRPLERDLECDTCSEPPLPRASDKVSTTPAKPRLECALREMPFGPMLPGCTPPPVDSVPRM
jgi:hypothetical protein